MEVKNYSLPGLWHFARLKFNVDLKPVNLSPKESKIADDQKLADSRNSMSASDLSTISGPIPAASPMVIPIREWPEDESGGIEVVFTRQ